MSTTTELILRNKELTTFDKELIAEHKDTCAKLDLSENNFGKCADFSFLTQFSALKTLILDNNNIKTLKSFPQLPSLDTLYLNNNKISSVKKLMDQCSRLFPNLTYLSILRNPCTPDMYFSEDEADAYQRSRYYIIHRLPTLHMLDATEVESEEKASAQRVGHMMIAARPDDDKSDESDDDAEGANKPQQYNVRDVMRTAVEPKVSTFLVRSKPRYDGANSEGNRFITNDDL